jgi:DNA-binding CsgD family transcriptional regulator
VATVRHQDYLDVASSRDIGTFRLRLLAFANKLEFPLVNATLVVEQPGAPPAIVAVRNAPEAFEHDTTEPAAVRRDPVLQRLKVSSAPFIYDQALYVASNAGDLWEQQAAYGYRTGISMALHLSGGRHFLLGVDRDAPLPNDQDEVMRLMADLQLLGAFAQETAVRLMIPQAQIDTQIPRLSAREQEILRWARDGKSSDVIAQLLNISLSTVNYHLRSAMQKLAVATKHQAAAKADSLGLL